MKYPKISGHIGVARGLEGVFPILVQSPELGTLKELGLRRVQIC